MLVIRNVLLKLPALFGRAAGLVLAGRILQNVNGFLLSILLVRKFGLSAAGTLAIATVAITILALVGTFGLTYKLARSNVPMQERNTIGLFACIATVVVSIPIAIALGLAVGQDMQESAVIALMALGGPFFAQNNIANALQVMQNKAGDSIIPPLGNLAGLAVAAAFAPNLMTFAALLAAFRFASIAIVFLRLPCARVGRRVLIRHISDGLAYITADAINLGSDQLSVLLVSYLITRDELGLFGLCRQMLTVSDTPGWSQVQAAYPALVANPRKEFAVLLPRLLWTGVFCAIGVAILTIPLGKWIYHIPGFIVLAPLLQVSTPIRYVLGVYDISLRAVGAIARCNRVSVLRGFLAIIIIPAGAWLYGAPGAVLATILHVIIATWLTRRVRMTDTHRGLDPIPLPEPTA